MLAQLKQYAAKKARRRITDDQQVFVQKTKENQLRNLVMHQRWNERCT